LKVQHVEPTRKEAEWHFGSQREFLTGRSWRARIGAVKLLRPASDVALLAASVNVDQSEGRAAVPLVWLDGHYMLIFLRSDF